MNTRIKQLRKELKLNAEQFGARIGVTKSAISKMECGKCNISEQSIRSICREFNVSEKWLRDGTGNMKLELSPDEEISYLIGKTLPHASDYLKQTLLSLIRLSEELTPHDWEVIRKFVDAMAGR